MSLLFRSKRRDDGSIPASSVRQRAVREQIRREIASEVNTPRVTTRRAIGRLSSWTCARRSMACRIAKPDRSSIQ